MENWIFAREITSHEWVKVRQLKGVLWIDEKDKKYDVCELDFTQKYLEPDVLNTEEFNRRNDEINQKYQESQALYMEMLSKMDANSIANHKAKIDEREYWRKLRGDIALEIIRKRGGNSYYSEVAHYKTIACMASAVKFRKHTWIWRASE